MINENYSDLFDEFSRFCLFELSLIHSLRSQFTPSNEIDDGFELDLESNVQLDSLLDDIFEILDSNPNCY